ncbi:MAG TPA: hypothetical protein ENN25_00870 [Euryarchaeota archaeon]|nr:hypothetical protein [Euryarchaeota archaeon]
MHHASARLVIRMLLTHKLFLGILAWTVLSVLMAASAGIEVLITLEIIGLLVARELCDGLLTNDVRDRLDFFIYAGLFLFLVVILRRVWLAIA